MNKQPESRGNSQRDATRHILPEGFIERTKSYKRILQEVEDGSVEEAIGDFARDVYPEKELRIWEQIARCYRSYVDFKPITDVATKREVFSVLLLTSMTSRDFSGIKRLTENEIRVLVDLYSLMRPAPRRRLAPKRGKAA